MSFKAITIGFRADGSSAIIFDANVEFSEQRRKFLPLLKEKVGEFERLELWTVQQGRIKQKRCRDSGGVDLSQLEPAPRQAPVSDTYTPPAWVPPEVPAPVPGVSAPVSPAAKPAASSKPKPLAKLAAKPAITGKATRK